MRRKNFGETTTEEEHKVLFSRKEDKHEHVIGFPLHQDIVNTAMGCHPVSSRLTIGLMAVLLNIIIVQAYAPCRPVSSRLITIRLRAAPFNITIVQAYVPTSDYDDNKIEKFYDQLQNVIDQTPKKDILVVQEDWNAKVGRDACFGSKSKSI